jgi:cytidylate kinase
VWSACAADVRARRVGLRDRLDPEVAAAANRSREESERRRYRRYYGIDIDDLGIYDMVLDSSSTGPDDLVAAIIARLSRRP